MVQGAETQVQITAGTGTKLRVLQDTIGADERYTEVIFHREGETYIAVFDRIAPAQNKYIFDIFNATSTKKVRIHRIWLFNWNITVVVGVLLEFELRRITARTLGTSVTPNARDLNNSLTANITADHASTGVTDSTLLQRVFSTGEEVVLNTLNTTTLRGFNYLDNLIYSQDWAGKIEPIILRQNQGLVLKQITNSTIGSVSAVVEFSEEDV